MIFLLSASGMSLSNELSSVLLKVSHLVSNKLYSLFECLIIYFMWSTSRGHLFLSAGYDTFRSHLSKLLSTVGSIL